LTHTHGTCRLIAPNIASNVIAYENEDVIESSFVDEDERSGKQKNDTVIYYINSKII
jgi:hypothetical protein